MYQDFIRSQILMNHFGVTTDTPLYTFPLANSVSNNYNYHSVTPGYSGNTSSTTSAPNYSGRPPDRGYRNNPDDLCRAAFNRSYSTPSIYTTAGSYIHTVIPGASDTTEVEITQDYSYGDLATTDITTTGDSYVSTAEMPRNMSQYSIQGFVDLCKYMFQSNWYLSSTNWV